MLGISHQALYQRLSEYNISTCDFLIFYLKGWMKLMGKLCLEWLPQVSTCDLSLSWDPWDIWVFRNLQWAWISAVKVILALPGQSKWRSCIQSSIYMHVHAVIKYALHILFYVAVTYLLYLDEQVPYLYFIHAYLHFHSRMSLPLSCHQCIMILLAHYQKSRITSTACTSSRDFTVIMLAA